MSLVNNNPGNLKPLQNGKSWQGQTGVDDDGFLVFDDLEDGFRAMALTIVHRLKTGYNTITTLIAGKNGQNAYSTTDQASYIHFVSQQTGVDPNTPISLNHDSVDALVAAMYEFEIGSDEVSQDTEDALQEGLTDAEQSHPDLYTMPAGSAPSAGPAKPKQSQPVPTPQTAKAQIPQVTDVMKTAGFGQNAIDFITNSKIGWIEVGVGVALILLIFRPKLEL